MIAFEIAVLVTLTLLNGVFAMSEIAVVSSRRARLQALADRGSVGARNALVLVDDPTRFLSTVQIGITMVGVVAGAYGGATLGYRLGAWLDNIPIFLDRGETAGIALVVVLITYLSIVLGELIPKRIALQDPERFAMLVASPMRLLSRVAAPFVWLLGASTDFLLRRLGIAGGRDVTVTEEEVRSMITEGARTGVFHPDEKAMIEGVLRLADRTVRSIMTPRPDVVWLKVDDPPETVTARIRDGRHSRYPVCRDDLDDVVGIIHTRDLLDRAVRGQPFDLATTLTTPMVVHDGITVLKLLELMRSSGIHMAMVADEYGSIEGLATVTDILETVAGAMPDEGGGTEIAAVLRDDGRWLVEGWMPVDEFEDLVGLSGLRGDDDYHTVAGFVLKRLGRLPATGESFEHGGARFEVVDMDNRRIDKILVTPLGHARPPDDAAAVIRGG